MRCCASDRPRKRSRREPPPQPRRPAEPHGARRTQEGHREPRTELDRLKKEEADLRQNIGTSKRPRRRSRRQQEFGRITRDYSGQDLYDSLLKRFDDAQLAAAWRPTGRASVSEFSSRRCAVVHLWRRTGIG